MPITEDIFDEEGSAGYEEFCTVNGEGLTITTEGNYKITVKFTVEGCKVSITAVTDREVAVEVRGRTDKFESYGVLKRVVVELQNGKDTYSLTISITGAELKTWAGGSSIPDWPCFTIVLTDNFGTDIWYDGSEAKKPTYTYAGSLKQYGTGDWCWDYKGIKETMTATFDITIVKTATDEYQITKVHGKG